MATKAEKNANKAIAAVAIGLGAYALWKTFQGSGSADAAAGEGSLGGSEDMFDDGDYWDLGGEQGFPSFIDPNTFPDQPQETYPDYPQEPSLPDINPSTPDSDSRSSASDFFTPVPTSNTPTTEPTGDTGIFGTGISAAEASLGLAGLLPSYATSFGKNLFSTGQEGAESLLKRTAKEAVEETPFFGKKLSDFAFKQTDDVAISTSETILKSSAGEFAEGTIKNLGTEAAESAFKTVGSEVAEAGAKSALKGVAKEAGGLAVKSIPIVGVAAGAEFDVLVDNRPRWIAYTANILGDIVGGALGVITVPAAVTGIGAAVPVVASVGGQVATESAVYGLYDLFTGKSFQSTPEELAAAQKLAADAQNQGTIVPEYAKTDFGDVILSGNTFALSGSAKEVAKLDDDEDIDLTRFKSDGTGGFFDTLLNQSVSSSVAQSRSSSGGSSKSSSSLSSYVNPVSVITSSIVKQAAINTGSSGSSSGSSSSSSAIDTSRFVAQAGGGYSDTVAMQSVSASEAAARTAASASIFSSLASFSSSSSSKSSGSSSSSKSSSSSSSSKSSSSSSSSSGSSSSSSSKNYSSAVSTSTPSFSSYVSSASKTSSSSSSSAAKTSSSSSSTKKTSVVSKVVPKISSWFKR